MFAAKINLISLLFSRDQLILETISLGVDSENLSEPQTRELFQLLLKVKKRLTASSEKPLTHFHSLQ